MLWQFPRRQRDRKCIQEKKSFNEVSLTAIPDRGHAENVTRAQDRTVTTDNGVGRDGGRQGTQEAKRENKINVLVFFFP